MFETKISGVGKTNGITISADMLAGLDVKEDDTIYLMRSNDNGLKVHAHDPALLLALAAAEEFMYKNRTILQALK